MTAPGTSAVLSPRALNRALLARQLLLRRHAMSAADALTHLIGLQAQAPDAPYVALWTRLEDFRPAELADALNGRDAVRIALMRSTLFLVTADDCLALRPLLQPVIDRGLRGSYAAGLVGVDLAALARAGREAADAAPITFAALGAVLAGRWPERNPRALGNAVRALVPLVQVPPRGVWGERGPSAHAPAESWLGRPLAAAGSVEGLVLRYLAAFGPASVADAQAWSGLTGLRAVMERMRPRLASFRDAAGRELFDLPDAPRPDPETPVPVRFLAEFDNILLSHADRTRIVPDAYRKRFMTPNGLVRGGVLVDGFLRGTWRVERGRGEAALRVELYAPLDPADRQAVEAEGGRLLSFVAGTPGGAVRFVPG